MLQNHIEIETERHNGFDDKLDEIIERQKYTNGSVNDLKMWRAYLTGGWAVLALILGIVVTKYL